MNRWQGRFPNAPAIQLKLSMNWMVGVQIAHQPIVNHSNVQRINSSSKWQTEKNYNHFQQKTVSKTNKYKNLIPKNASDSNWTDCSYFDRRVAIHSVEQRLRARIFERIDDWVRNRLISIQHKSTRAFEMDFVEIMKKPIVVEGYPKRGCSTALCK